MADFTNSPFIFTAPVRKYKANDPYYWEIDNIPIQQLEENCLWLKDQVDSAIAGGAGGGGGSTNINRSELTELRPTVAGSVVSVEPGRFSARINDAFTLSEALSQPDFNAGTTYLGEGSNWFTKNSPAVQTAVNKIYNTAGANALRLNGLIEKFSQYAIYGVALGTSVITGSTVTSTSLGDGLSWTGFPLIDNPKFYDILSVLFTNSLNNISYTESISKEFTKRWRGVARTSIVDVPATISVTVPPFDSNDFFYIDVNGSKITLGATQRIDLVFIYSKPVDQGSTTIIKQGSIQTISQPQLGVLVGAGLGLDRSVVNGGTGEYAQVVKNSDGTNPSLADAFMLASKADTVVANGGFVLGDGTAAYGSFPSPDDLLNLAPLLANNISEGDWRTVGQSVLPVAYIVVDSSQNGTIPTTHLIDIRPFFRTAELTYDERAGIAGAAPSLSLANPAIGRRELETHVNTIVTNAFGTGGGDGGGSPPIVPRVVGGGYVWGGKKWGPEGAITTAMNDSGNWISDGTFGMTYNDVPDDPDWDWATWTQYLDATKAGAGTSKNDWINFKYTINREMATSSTLDFQEQGGALDAPVFTDSFGTTLGKNDAMTSGRSPAPLMMYWVRKRFHFTLPAGFSNYCVKANLANCVPLSEGGDPSPWGDQSGGTEGVWISKGSGWFDINVGWVGPDPYVHAAEAWPGFSTNSVEGVSFPSSNRNSNKFRSWAVLYPELGVGPVAAGNANNAVGSTTTGFVPQKMDQNLEIKVDKVGVCTYPTILFEIVAFPSGWENSGFQLYDPTMPHNGTATLILK